MRTFLGMFAALVIILESCVVLFGVHYPREMGLEIIGPQIILLGMFSYFLWCAVELRRLDKMLSDLKAQ